jgi:hypothetical protein
LCGGCCNCSGYVELSSAESTSGQSLLLLWVLGLCRLYDVIHSDRKLYLVFEFLDLDLKKMMDTTPGFSKDHRLIKVTSLASPLAGCHVWI